MANPGTTTEEKKKRRYLLLLLLLLLLLAGCVAAIIMLLSDRASGPVLEPDYPLVEVDPGAKPIEGDGGSQEKPETPQGGGSVSLVYSDQVTLDAGTGLVTLYYQNPSRSIQNVVVQVVLESGEDEFLLAQSGRLEPGFMVTSLARDEGFDAKLSPGGYKGHFNLLFYDPDTGERAVVDTRIPITIQVNG